MLQIVVFGASGDLAHRKTFPALFSLYRHSSLSFDFAIYGYARSNLTTDAFRSSLEPILRKQTDNESMIREFLIKCHYVSGQYDAPNGFVQLKKLMEEHEAQSNREDHDLYKDVRLFYLALPPTVFATVCNQIKQVIYDPSLKNRIIVEKPFGKDLESSNALSNALAPLFDEADFFRIDHYLGKEMVKNVMVLRFANLCLGALWNRQYISNVQIVFKETIGVEGRGGYFDEFGIIRDVMQNHLLQMLTVVAMERPVSLDAEDIRNEKVKVLSCIKPITPDQVILGQYGKSADGTKPGYIDDETIPKSSITPTYAMAVLHIHNERWEGVPFILKCGKGLSEQKAEIRIQFTDVPGNLFPGCARNELVIRVQPNESVYLKMLVKRPGLESQPIVSDLDLSYGRRYSGLRIPEAYESLILDALRGDKANFVRSDELQLAWKIFTPLLHYIDNHHLKPIEYPFGSRGPAEADTRLAELGYVRSSHPYSWPTQEL